TMAEQQGNSSRLLCRWCHRQRVQPGPILSEEEVAALFFYVQRLLPSMLSAGVWPGSGYPLQEHQWHWARVRRFIRAATHVQSTNQELTHHWVDITRRTCSAS
ncbi:hypothetical protein NDU88_004972, partial [Pleurodeles waltl]